MIDTEHLVEINRAAAAVDSQAAAIVKKALLVDVDKFLPLGPLIRMRREALGMSLADVAKAAGCTKSHVWELEQGRSRNPSVATLHKLAMALQAPFQLLAIAALSGYLAAEAPHAG